ncbi:hypothetical protein F7725_002603 [Dissostichus mawsoni]|uniref:Uncharacterized protein n=1 Tax=Dissostichus mawsoni TaxID=36200 RepID=A0A7J5Y2T8_DISMA|nr:hypothetical protein F7725_002603 [Dissostichus mawsoni]
MVETLPQKHFHTPRPLLGSSLCLGSCFRLHQSPSPSGLVPPDRSSLGCSPPAAAPCPRQQDGRVYRFSSLCSAGSCLSDPDSTWRPRDPPSAVVEGGAVYTCPWNHASCQQLQFDNTGRIQRELQMEFKSKQWFGRPYDLTENTSWHVLLSISGPRSGEPSGSRSGFCQAGFSVDFLKKNNRVVVGGPGSFYWQGQLISDDVSEIFTRFSKTEFYDDSYLGYSVTVGDFNDDGKEVNIFNGNNMDSMVNFTGTQMAAYFGHSVQRLM